MRHVYLSRPWEGTTLPLPEGPLHHLKHVLRIKEGTRVQLVDGAGTVAEATLTFSGKAGQCTLLGPATHTPPPPELHLFLGVPKPPALELLLRSCTELGVTHFHLFLSENSTVSERALLARIDRYKKITIAALEQSQRGWLPTLRCAKPSPTEPLPLKDLPQQHRYLLTLPTPSPEPPPHLEQGAATVYAVGPEGGFSARELTAFLASGWSPLSLGTGVLRTVTAAISGAALLHRRSTRCVEERPANTYEK